MPVASAPTMPRNGLKPACTTQRENPGRKAHRRGKRQIDLADGDDEDQRHDETKRHRQCDEDGAVNLPMHENQRTGDHENGDHRDEDGERADGGPVRRKETPQSAVGRTGDRRRARIGRIERQGHGEAPACGMRRIERSDALRVGDFLHEGDERARPSRPRSWSPAAPPCRDPSRRTARRCHRRDECCGR